MYCLGAAPLQQRQHPLFHDDNGEAFLFLIIMIRWAFLPTFSIMWEWLIMGHRSLFSALSPHSSSGLSLSWVFTSSFTSSTHENILSWLIRSSILHSIDISFSYHLLWNLDFLHSMSFSYLVLMPGHTRKRHREIHSCIAEKKGGVRSMVILGLL